VAAEQVMPVERRKRESSLGHENMGAVLETLGAVLAGTTGIVGISQVVLRFIAGPNQEARELGIKCFDLFRECQNDDIDFARFRHLDDELGVFQHRVRFKTKRLIKELQVLNEEVDATSPLRIPADSGDIRTHEKQMELHATRFDFCQDGQDKANDLIRWTGTLDRWMIGK
jgi:hypothetical protein